MICKIVRKFVNTGTAYEKYFLINRNILTQPIQMQLSQKNETLSNYLHAFPKSILTFKYCLKKDDSHSPYISEIKDSEKHGQINV